MNKLRLRRLLLSFLIITFFQSLCFGQLNLNGSLSVWMVSDPQYFKPGGWIDWSRKLWIGSNIYNSTPFVGWGSTRLSLQPSIGSMSEPIYIYFPLYIMNSVQYERGLSEIKIGATDFIALFRSRPFQVSMTGRRLGESNIWSYTSPGDPLGLLKLPSTSEPALTFKVMGKLPRAWELTGYYLADGRCNFFPVRETIPDAVFGALEKNKSEMPFFDETPSYRMLRATKKISEGSTLGILWGQKQAENIIPRENENGLYIVPKSNKVGYLKNNIGLDFVTKVPLGNGPNMVVAFARSAGEWRHYRSKNDILEPISWDSLGRLSGDAFKISISEAKLGSVIVEGAFHKVDPNFQWVAVRDRRYAYTYDFLSFEDPVFEHWGWRTVEDKEYYLRDASLKNEYESDVDKYLGLRSYWSRISLPGTLKIGVPKKTNLTIEVSDIKNLEPSRTYLDPVTADELQKSYRQYNASLDMDYTSNIMLGIYGLDRTYFLDNYFQEVGLNYFSKLDKDLTLEGNINTRWRLRDDDGQGKGLVSQGKLLLKGLTAKKVRIETGIDYRVGNYDIDLHETTKDKVLSSEYNYFKFSHYLEHNYRVQMLGFPVSVKAAGEVIKISTNFPLIKSGTSLISYLQNQISVNRSTTFTLTSVGVVGPHQEGFPSNKISSLMDGQLTYKIAGANDNTLVLRYTKRFENDGVKTNWHATLVSTLGKHQLVFAYGHRPAYESRSYYINGTLRDTRYYPNKELIGRPWMHWGDNSAYAKTTQENYYSMSWNIRF